MEEAQNQTVNPLHVMEDEELVSRMTLAREQNDNELFRHFRQELMYRLRLSHLATWSPPRRFPEGSTAVNTATSTDFSLDQQRANTLKQANTPPTSGSEG